MASAEPGILYIPTEDVTLRPANMAPCGSEVNSALGCGGASMEVEEPPYADAEGLTTALQANFEGYDLLVTNTRPEPYISYTMLLASDEPLDMASAAYQSFTCAFGGINCGARNRNDIVSTSGNTENCIDPEIVHAATFAVGRNLGLEGVDNPEDWMHYVVAPGPAGGPDYTTPPLGFQDVCNDRVQQQGFNDRGDQIDLPLECTSVDHFECDGPGGTQGQNSHQDLLQFFGPTLEDTDAPVFSNLMPGDAAVIQQGEDLVLDVDIADADVVVGARWTVASPALEEAGIPGGALTQCTNDVCDSNWDDATPLKATDSDWSLSIAMLPAGVYTITLEASDYHGNVAAPETFTVTIEGDDAGTGGSGGAESGGNVDDTGGNPPPPPLDTGVDSSGDGTSGTEQVDDEGGGCSCRTSQTPGQVPGGAALMLLGLMGLGTMRRRG